MTIVKDALPHRLALAIAELQGCRTGDYAKLVQGDHKTVHRTLQKLRAYGYVRSESVLRESRVVALWWLTEEGQALLDRGDLITLAHRDQPDDHWEPKPWVHPIRARVLGLTR